MRALLQEGIVVSPGVYDGLSARMVEKFGFKAAATGGSGVSPARMSQPDFIINARTDAIAVEGLKAAIARARLYIAAGADMVFPDAVDSEEQIQRFVDAVEAPVSINIGFGIRARPTTPLIPIERLAKIGVARVTMARMLPSAALMGMHKALELMRDHVATGTLHDRPDLLYGMDEITDLMGYAKIAELEAQFLPDEQLARKYGTGEVDYVVREPKA